MARKPNSKPRHTQDPGELARRLRVAHKSARNMSRYAGRLLQEISSLKREIYARDLLIAQLKEQLTTSETLHARAMNY